MKRSALVGDRVTWTDPRGTLRRGVVLDLREHLRGRYERWIDAHVDWTAPGAPAYVPVEELEVIASGTGKP